MRATDGRTPNPQTKTRDSKPAAITKKSPKVKYSTIVNTADVDTFFVRYADICKAGMGGMKKRDRSAKKKGKAKTKPTKV